MKKKGDVTKPVAKAKPNIRDEIERIAHEIYVKSGRVGGSDLDNWLEAERIVSELQEGTKTRRWGHKKRGKCQKPASSD